MPALLILTILNIDDCGYYKKLVVIIIITIITTKHLHTMQCVKITAI